MSVPDSDHLDFDAIRRYRATLPDWRRAWFDTLNMWHQNNAAQSWQLSEDVREDAETLGGPGA